MLFDWKQVLFSKTWYPLHHPNQASFQVKDAGGSWISISERAGILTQIIPMAVATQVENCNYVGIFKQKCILNVHSKPLKFLADKTCQGFFIFHTCRKRAWVFCIVDMMLACRCMWSPVSRSTLVHFDYGNNSGWQKTGSSGERTCIAIKIALTLKWWIVIISITEHQRVTAGSLREVFFLFVMFCILLWWTQLMKCIC